MLVRHHAVDNVPALSELGIELAARPHRVQQGRDDFIDARFGCGTVSEWAEITRDELLPAEARRVERLAVVDTRGEQGVQFLLRFALASASFLAIDSLAAGAALGADLPVDAVAHVNQNGRVKLVVVVAFDLGTAAQRAAVVGHVALVADRLADFDLCWTNPSAAHSCHRIEHTPRR